MKNNFKSFIYHACGYSVLIALLFYAFAAISGYEEALISFGRFALIVAFSLVISASELIFAIKKLKRILCYVIHFVLLYLGFLVIFILINENKFRPSFILSSFVIFAVLYLLIALTVNLIVKAMRKNETKATKPSSSASYKAKK